MRATGSVDTLSIVIPSYNSEKTIEATLAGIRRQSRSDLVAEVIVVDSSDDRKTKQIISRHLSDRDRLIHSGVRVMPAIGRNIGAEHARGKVLAFIDSDARPAADWAARIMEAWEEGCRVGGGSVSLPDFQKRKLIAVAQFFLQFNEYVNWGGSRSKPFVPSCNLFCGRELFRRAGGFPPLRTAEDVLFGLRVSKLRPLWFVPAIKIDHIFREEWKGFLRNQFILGRGNIRYRRSHYPRSFIYKRWWPMLFLPAFTAIKLGRIILRVLRTGVRPTLRFLMALPVFLVGLLSWAAGFAAGVTDHGEKDGNGGLNETFS